MLKVSHFGNLLLRTAIAFFAVMDRRPSQQLFNQFFREGSFSTTIRARFSVMALLPAWHSWPLEWLRALAMALLSLWFFLNALLFVRHCSIGAE